MELMFKALVMQFMQLCINYMAFMLGQERDRLETTRKARVMADAQIADLKQFTDGLVKHIERMKKQNIE